MLFIISTTSGEQLVDNNSWAFVEIESFYSCKVRLFMAIFLHTLNRCSGVALNFEIKGLKLYLQGYNSVIVLKSWHKYNKINSWIS